MGKTTYCQKLAYDWATKQGEWDHSFPKIEVLLLLRCRHIKSNIWEAIDDQILPEDIDEAAKENFKKFIRENQSKVLLVLDGLDEVDPRKLAMYVKLVESKELSDCHIVLTSRHEAGTKLRRYCNTLWEIVGFTKEDAQSFIRKHFRNIELLAEKLIGELWHDDLDDDSDDESELKGLTKNPLNTALLCVIFEDFKGVLPKNRTQLYIEIVLCVLRRYEKRSGLSSISEHLMVVYKKELLLLGSMALRSLRKGELYFEEHEFRGNLSLLIKFGFLSIQAGGSKRKPCMCCGFLHKSFQEFFAGFYLACQILGGEVSCSSVLIDERYLHELNQVFVFMSGIVASQCEEAAVSLCNSTVAHINLQRGDQVQSNFLLALRCISECSAQKENLQFRLVCSLGKYLRLKTLKVPPYFGFDDPRPSIELFLDALTVNSTITSLDLQKNSIDGNGAASLSQALKANSSLTSLDLSTNRIEDTGAASLSQALTANSSLTSLDLSWNGIGATGAASLSQAIKASSSLTSLDLSFNRIHDTGAAHLAQSLKAKSKLTNLNLSWNRISLTGADYLSRALTANSSLTSLDLSWNRIGDSGASSLAQALTANSSLTSLDLSWNHIGDDGADSLAQALKANSFLTKLNVFANEISLVAASALERAAVTGNKKVNVIL